MQTFLPYENFEQSVSVLDYRRLGKQRVEAMQILKVLQSIKEGVKVAWMNHPAVLMWRGYEESLKSYMNLCIKEWMNRGYKNTMKLNDITTIINPWWLGNEQFHRAMRSRLIMKNEEYYLPLFPEDKDFNSSNYYWPVNESKTFKLI